MRIVSSVSIALSLITASLFLALVAEICYLFWWKKRRSNNNNTTINNEANQTTPAKELLYMFCWKRPSSLSSNTQDLTPTHDDPNDVQVQIQSNSNKDHLQKSYGAEDSIEAELMRLHSLAGPPRFLFTIKEETKEDLESEDGRKRGRSLSDFLASPHVFTPPLTPLNCYKQNEFNPLFESSKDDDFTRMWTSPPPKFKFLQDAEEKLYRKRLNEEAAKVQIINGDIFQKQKGNELGHNEDDASFITIVIGKSRDRENQFNHSASSQVIPLRSSPMSITTLTTTISSPLHEKPSCKE